MSVAEYATPTGLRLRLFGPGANPSAEDTLLREICNEVNDFIEGPTGAGRALGPIPAFAVDEVTASEGDRLLTLPAVAGLASGDRLLIGEITGTHEAVTVLAIEENDALTADDWAEGTYNLDDVVQPTTPNGHTYRAVVAGTTGDTEPTFPTDGSAVIDGSVAWIDQGLADATVHLTGELENDYTDAPLQRIVVADGSGAVGRGLRVRAGILSLAAVEIGTSLPTFSLQPAERRPGWPYSQVVLRSTVFPVGLENVRLIGPGPCVGLPSLPAFGFPAIHDNIRAIAYSLAAARYQMRQSGGTYEINPGNDQVQVGQFLISTTDYFALRAYTGDFGIS